MASVVSFVGAAWKSFRLEWSYVAGSAWDLALLSILPFLALVAIALTFSSGVIRDIPIAVVDMDRSALSHAMERNLLADRKIQVYATPTALASAWPLVRSGKVYDVVFIPSGFERAARRRQNGSVTVYFDASFQTAASQASAAAQAAVKAAISAQVSPSHEGDNQPSFHLNAVKVQVNVVGNAEQNFELYLGALISPIVLNIFLSCAVVFAVGREVEDATLSSWSQACGGRLFAALLGKLAPYILVFWGWMIAWTAYIGGWCDWGVQGNLTLLVLAQLALVCATTSIAVFLVALSGSVGTALSISGLYAGSGFSFADITLPVNGASLFTRVWTAILPSTSYLHIQQQQLILGSSVARSIPLLGVLVLFTLIPLLISMPRLNRLCLRPPPQKKPPIKFTGDGFLASMFNTFGVAATSLPILSTVVGSVVLYAFYYPTAYSVQTAIKLPVAVVDLDRSPLSRGFLRKLDATREMQVAVQTETVAAAQTLLRNDRVDGVVVVSNGLEASVLKGSPGGIAAYLKGAYLVRARYLGEALASSMKASEEDVLAPLMSIARGDEASVGVIERPLYNTSNLYADYVVPGVGSIIVQQTLLFGVAMYTGMRREETKRRMKPKAFIGVWAAFTVLGTLTTLFFFGFVLWFQDYPRGGNLLGLLVCAPLFSGAVSALGLLVGSGFKRRERSLQILAASSTPLFFFGTLTWPASSMSPVVQALARLVPSSSAIPMFVRLNSSGASLTEIAPLMESLLILLALYLTAAFVRLTEWSPSPAVSVPSQP